MTFAHTVMLLIVLLFTSGNAYSSEDLEICDRALIQTQPENEAALIQEGVREIYSSMGYDIDQIPGQEKFITLRRSYTAEYTQQIDPKLATIPEGTVLGAVTTKVEYFVPIQALVRVDSLGMNIYWVNSDGEIQSMWKGNEYSAKIRADVVGPRNLTVIDKGNDGYLIMYTNEFYIKSILIKDTNFQYINSEFLPKAFPSSSADNSTIEHLLRVEWTQESGEVSDLYFAKTNGYWRGALFSFDDDGKVVFTEGLGSLLTEVLRNQSLFIPELPTDLKNYFHKDDAQIQPGGRYEFAVDGD